MTELHRWYVLLWLPRHKSGISVSSGPHDTHAEAMLRMQEMQDLNPHLEYTVADIVFPSEYREALDAHFNEVSAEIEEMERRQGIVR